MQPVARFRCRSFDWFIVIFLHAGGLQLPEGLQGWVGFFVFSFCFCLVYDSAVSSKATALADIFSRFVPTV